MTGCESRDDVELGVDWNWRWALRQSKRRLLTDDGGLRVDGCEAAWRKFRLVDNDDDSEVAKDAVGVFGQRQIFHFSSN